MDYKSIIEMSASANGDTVKLIFKFYEDIIEATVTRTTDALEQWISEVCTDQSSSEDHFVGLNTKHASILQLCVGRRCLVFQLWHATIPESLKDFLKNPLLTFFAIDPDEASGLLKKYYGLSLSPNRKNLPTLAREQFPSAGIVYDSVTELARAFLKKEVKKSVEVLEGDFFAEKLSIPQMMYACIDAFLALQVGIYLDEFSKIPLGDSPYDSELDDCSLLGDDMESLSDGDELKSKCFGRGDFHFDVEKVESFK